MSFGPALALGVAAREEVVDLDVILPRSDEDMAGMWSEEDRAREGAALLDKLRAAAPPGLEFVGLRVLGPGERKLGELIAAADYAADIGAEQAAALAPVMAERLAGPLTVTRAGKARAGRGRRAEVGGEHAIDIGEALLAAAVDPESGVLRFRVRLSSDAPGARPREVVQALVGAAVPDHRIVRERLLAERDGDFVGLAALGPVFGRKARAEAVASVMAE
jgi:hypothetical protein